MKSHLLLRDKIFQAKFVAPGLLFWMCIVFFAGCGTKHPIAVQVSRYRLEKIQDEYLVLPPSLPAVHNYKEPINISLQVSGVVRSAAGCSIQNELFRLTFSASRRNVAVLQLPSANELEDIAEKRRVEKMLTQFLGQLAQLSTNSCVTPETGTALRTLVMDSLPFLRSQGLLVAYDYYPGRGGIELKPGLRLRIERALLYKCCDLASAANLRGTTTALYETRQSADGHVYLDLDAKLFEPEATRCCIDASQPDFRLHGLLGGASYDRVFLLTDFVPTNVRRVAMIVGADDVGQLDTIEAELERNILLRCPEVQSRWHVRCYFAIDSLTIPDYSWLKAASQEATGNRVRSLTTKSLSPFALGFWLWTFGD